MHSARFIDQPVREAWGTLIDEGKYLGSVRTIYRVLEERGETKERRNQRANRHYAAPHLVATQPNEVWTWDITKLATTIPGKFLNLYLIIDLWSRYIVGWMIAEHENSELAKQLVRETVERYRMEGRVLTIHNDRGSPMTATSFTDLLVELKVNVSRSRPRVSNDNPHSEAINKTVKSQPDYPGQFESASHARTWFADFENWYNYDHCHSGLALFRPGDLFFGHFETLVLRRQATLNRAYAAHPERFVKGPPTVKRPPAQAIINPIDPGELPKVQEALA